jgi:hypothetical protein
MKETALIKLTYNLSLWYLRRVRLCVQLCRVEAEVWQLYSEKRSSLPAFDNLQSICVWKQFFAYRSLFLT